MLFDKEPRPGPHAIWKFPFAPLRENIKMLARDRNFLFPFSPYET